MKKFFGIVLCLLLVAGGLYFFSGNRKNVSQPSSETTGDKGVSSSSANSPRAGERNRQRPHPVKGDAAESLNTERPNVTTVRHEGPEFNRGEMSNTAFGDGGLQLGTDPSFVPRFNPTYRIFGNFVSPEERVAEPFNAVIPNVDFTAPKDTSITLEIRTKPADGDWSVWEEVDMTKLGQPINVPPSVAWEYRLMLFANDPTQGPKIRSVSISTQKAASATAQNGNGFPADNKN